MKKGNKVKFNLKNVHIAPINRETGEYEQVFSLPGAVNMSMSAQGEINKFYADGVVYYQSAPNDGYEGDLEIAMVTEEFQEKIFGEIPNEDGVMVENVENVIKDFALGFQIDGDVHNTLFWFYNCSATRATTEASTNEASKTPKTDKLTISCTCDADGNVRAKTTARTSDEVRRKWFDTVYKKGGSSTGADSVKVWPVSTQPLDKKYGDKSAADLIGRDISIEWNGRNGKVYGTVHNIKEPWTEFSGSNNTGHFVPILIDPVYDGEEITMEGAAKEKKAADLKWIVRLENLTGGKKITAKVGGAEIFSLDFSEATLEEQEW